MTSVIDIERAIEKLPAADLNQLRQWFAEFDARMWDEQLDQDVSSGKLDALAEEALEDLAHGHAR